MSAAHEIRHEPFWDDRLSATVNKAVEMARNGYDSREIAEELDTSGEVVRVYLCTARRKGVSVPRLPYPGWAARVPTEHLLRARERYHSMGITRGVCGRIGRQFGMTMQAVKERLRKHDKKQKGASP